MRCWLNSQLFNTEQTPKLNWELLRVVTIVSLTIVFKKVSILSLPPTSNSKSAWRVSKEVKSNKINRGSSTAVSVNYTHITIWDATVKVPFLNRSYVRFKACNKCQTCRIILGHMGKKTLKLNSKNLKMSDYMVWLDWLQEVNITGTCGPHFILVLLSAILYRDIIIWAVGIIKWAVDKS